VGTKKGLANPLCGERKRPRFTRREPKKQWTTKAFNVRLGQGDQKKEVTTSTGQREKTRSSLMAPAVNPKDEQRSCIRS